MAKHVDIRVSTFADATQSPPKRCFRVEVRRGADTKTVNCEVQDSPRVTQMVWDDTIGIAEKTAGAER